jgi:ribosomal protein L31
MFPTTVCNQTYTTVPLRVIPVASERRTVLRKQSFIIRVRKCSVHVEIISKSHPEVQRSFGSRSAASMSKLFQSPIQKYSVHSGPEVQRPRRNYCKKCSVHSGPEVQRPCRNYFKVRSRSTAFIRVRKCSVHVEIIAKSHPEVQRSFGSRSAASMSKLFQSKKKIGGIPII